MAQKKSKVHKFPLVGKKYRTSYYDQKGDRQYITHADEHELMRMKIAAQEEVAEGRHTAAKNAGTLTEAYHDYMASKKNQQIEEGIEDAYIASIERHWRLHLSTLKVDGFLIAKKNIKQFSDHNFMASIKNELVRDQISKGNELRYSKAICTTMCGILRLAIFNKKCPAIDKKTFAMMDIDFSNREDDEVKIPPLQNVRRLIEAAELWDREGRQDNNAFTDQYRLKAIRENRNTPYALIFRCLAQMGCRPSELRGLKLCHDSRDNNQKGLVLFETNQPGVRLNERADKTGKLGKLKTTNSYRWIPIGPDLAERLKKHIADRQVQPGQLVFASSNGKPLADDPWRKRLHEITAHHDITWYNSLYTFRHCAASMWIKQGRNIKWVSTRMGHKSAAFTLDTYSHLWDGDGEDAAAAVDTENMLYGSAVAAE